MKPEGVTIIACSCNRRFPFSVIREMSASVIDTIADEGGKLDEVMDAIDAAVREADPSATPTPQRPRA